MQGIIRGRSVGRTCRKSHVAHVFVCRCLVVRGCECTLRRGTVDSAGSRDGCSFYACRLGV